jgi:hypothetical protein
MKSATKLSLIAPALLLVLLLAAGFALRFHGAQARSDEFARLAGTSAPALPEDVATPADPRPDGTGWFAELASARIRWTPEELADRGRHDALRARAADGDLGADARDAFAALSACAATESPAAVSRVVDVIAARDGIVDAPPCAGEAAHLLAVGLSARTEVARRAREYGPVPARSVAEALDRAGAAFPQLPVVQTVELADALLVEIARDAWNERPDRALERVRTLSEVTRLLDGVPLLTAGFAATEVELRRLAAVEFLLPRLAPDSDLAWLEADLAAAAPRARLVRAAEGERAFGNRAFELARRGGVQLTGLAGTTWLPASLTISLEQAALLSSWRERIARMHAPAASRAPEPAPGPIVGTFASEAWSLPSTADAILARADVLEARIALARAALAARRGGALALLEHVRGSSDTFDARPLRTATSDGGLLVLWSVGADRVDDGGRDEARDVVWRFRQR